MSTETDTDEWGWEAHMVAQLQSALSMTPAERLAWLERTNASMRALVGLARQSREDPARESENPTESR